MIQQNLIQAINAMMVIEFRYNGSRRIVEPHALGINNRGKLTLCAWQLSGGSGNDWRDYHVERISELVVSEDAFAEPRPGFNPNDKTLKTVICSL